MVSTGPAKKVPITTQRMWVIAVEDYDSEQARLAITRSMPGVTSEAIANCEHRLRLRLAICNAIDFLITNKDDIDRVIAARRGKNT